ncbi:hypothetical protein DIPPA_31864 [Diplonema papillatum]|nr:hypothetical protein DIPPA_31864 [Diplonema papillatum]
MCDNSATELLDAFLEIGEGANESAAGAEVRVVSVEQRTVLRGADDDLFVADLLDGIASSDEYDSAGDEAEGDLARALLSDDEAWPQPQRRHSNNGDTEDLINSLLSSTAAATAEEASREESNESAHPQKAQPGGPSSDGFDGDGAADLISSLLADTRGEEPSGGGAAELIDSLLASAAGRRGRANGEPVADDEGDLIDSLLADTREDRRGDDATELLSSLATAARGRGLAGGGPAADDDDGDLIDSLLRGDPDASGKKRRRGNAGPEDDDGSPQKKKKQTTPKNAQNTAAAQPEPKRRRPAVDARDATVGSSAELGNGAEEAVGGVLNPVDWTAPAQTSTRPVYCDSICRWVSAAAWSDDGKRSVVVHGGYRATYYPRSKGEGRPLLSGIVEQCYLKANSKKVRWLPRPSQVERAHHALVAAPRWVWVDGARKQEQRIFCLGGIVHSIFRRRASDGPVPGIEAPRHLYAFHPESGEHEEIIQRGCVPPHALNPTAACTGNLIFQLGGTLFVADGLSDILPPAKPRTAPPPTLWVYQYNSLANMWTAVSVASPPAAGPNHFPGWCVEPGSNTLFGAVHAADLAEHESGWFSVSTAPGAWQSYATHSAPSLSDGFTIEGRGPRQRNLMAGPRRWLPPCLCLSAGQNKGGWIVSVTALWRWRPAAFPTTSARWRKCELRGGAKVVPAAVGLLHVAAPGGDGGLARVNDPIVLLLLNKKRMIEVMTFRLPELDDPTAPVWIGVDTEQKARTSRTERLLARVLVKQAQTEEAGEHPKIPEPVDLLTDQGILLSGPAPEPKQPPAKKKKTAKAPVPQAPRPPAGLLGDDGFFVGER